MPTRKGSDQVTLRVRTVPYGREAALVLRDELAAAQADDPLAPVTVVVPRNLTGLAVRRLLASGDLGPPPGGGRPGVVNVTFTTTSRLAEDIAGADLAAAGVSAAGDAVLRAAARGALAASPERSFAAVADHPATARALVATYRDLGSFQLLLSLQDEEALKLFADGNSLRGRGRLGCFLDGFCAHGHGRLRECVQFPTGLGAALKLQRPRDGSGPVRRFVRGKNQ